MSGSKKILMTELKELYEEAGLEDVKSYIQSGNILFQTKAKITASTLQTKIETAILDRFGFEVPVINRTLNEFEKIVNANPFIGDKNIDKEKLHVTFLKDPADKTLIDQLPQNEFAPDTFKVINKEIYLYIPGGYGVTKLNNNFFERRLKVSATTRNWKTVNQLLTMALAY